MDYFKIQDEFYKRMKSDYESGLISNPVYKPYFDWKFYHAPLSSISNEILFNIREIVSQEMDFINEKYPEAYKFLIESPTLDDVWRPYRGYGKDKYLYSYLDGMDSELSRLMMVV